MIDKVNLKAVLIVSVIVNILLVYTLSNDKGDKKHEIPQKKNISELDFFTKFYKVDNQILFAGDSWIAKGNWKERLNIPNVFTQGEGGITTYQFFMKFNNKIVGKPHKVFFLLGVNDIVKGAPEEFIMENYHRILYELKAKSPLTEIYVISLFPVRSELLVSDALLYLTNEKINALNFTLKEFTETFGINYVDVNSLLKDSSGEADSLYTIDGIHLSEQGYERIMPIIEAHVKN